MAIIDIQYSKDMPHLKPIAKGDWIDLMTAADVTMKQGEFKYIDLGVAMKVPDGYEAHMAPRSSTFKKWGVIQTNSIGK